jgi:hypothetical protein
MSRGSAHVYQHDVTGWDAAAQVTKGTGKPQWTCVSAAFSTILRWFAQPRNTSAGMCVPRSGRSLFLGEQQAVEGCDQFRRTFRDFDAVAGGELEIGVALVQDNHRNAPAFAHLGGE